MAAINSMYGWNGARRARWSERAEHESDWCKAFRNLRDAPVNEAWSWWCKPRGRCVYSGSVETHRSHPHHCRRDVFKTFLMVQMNDNCSCDIIRPAWTMGKVNNGKSGRKICRRFHWMMKSVTHMADVVVNNHVAM